jgi:hypothetical protein
MHEKINQQQGAFKTERSFGFANPVSDWATARGIAASRALPTAGKCVSLGQPTARPFLRSFEPRNFLNLLGCNAWSAVSRTCS